MHLIVDTHSGNQELMRNEELLRKWLLEAANTAGMTVYGKPTVIDFPWPESSGTALSAVCFLGESSILVHTYPEREFVFIDVFSCKDFDADQIIGYISRTFQVRQPTVMLLNRGINMRTGAIIPVELGDYDNH